MAKDRSRNGAGRAQRPSGAFLRSAAGAGALALAAVGVAACGSSGSSSAPPSTARHRGTPSTAATVTVETERSRYGTILATSSGMTLYRLSADTPTSSACNSACAAVWPPLTVTGRPTVGPGLDQSLVGTITRPNGTHQVTYNGHPLYTFSGDGAAGQVNGEGINSFGGVWDVLNRSGDPVTKPVPTPAPSTTAPSGYGSNYGGGY